MESMEKIRLNNGVQMPPIGYGVYRMTDPAACEVPVLREGTRITQGAIRELFGMQRIPKM